MPNVWISKCLNPMFLHLVKWLSGIGTRYDDSDLSSLCALLLLPGRRFNSPDLSSQCRSNDICTLPPELVHLPFPWKKFNAQRSWPSTLPLRAQFLWSHLHYRNASPPELCQLRNLERFSLCMFFFMLSLLSLWA
jgi:hypothetical protein